VASRIHSPAISIAGGNGSVFMVTAVAVGMTRSSDPSVVQWLVQCPALLGGLHRAVTPGRGGASPMPGRPPLAAAPPHTRAQVTETESHPQTEYRVAFSLLDAPLVDMSIYGATGYPQSQPHDFYRDIPRCPAIAPAVGCCRDNPTTGGDHRVGPIVPEDEPSQGETA